MREIFKPFTKPAVTLVVATILLVTSLWELGDELFETLWRGEVQAEHGTALYGVFIMLKTLGEVGEAAHNVAETGERG